MSTIVDQDSVTISPGAGGRSKLCGACGGSGSKYFDEDAHAVGCCERCGGSGKRIPAVPAGECPKAAKWPEVTPDPLSGREPDWDDDYQSVVVEDRAAERGNELLAVLAEPGWLEVMPAIPLDGYCGPAIHRQEGECVGPRLGGGGAMSRPDRRCRCGHPGRPGTMHSGHGDPHAGQPRASSGVSGESHPDLDAIAARAEALNSDDLRTRLEAAQGVTRAYREDVPALLELVRTLEEERDAWRAARVAHLKGKEFSVAITVGGTGAIETLRKVEALAERWEAEAGAVRDGGALTSVADTLAEELRAVLRATE